MAAMGGDASMGVGSTPTRRPTTGGGSPNAKRPQTIVPVTTPDGPLLDLPTASKEIYILKRQFEAMETWANSVNTNTADHASHLDLHRDKMEVNRLQVVMALQESKKAAELAESDLRRVHTEDQQRDAQLRSELDSRLCTQLNQQHDALTAELASLKAELASSASGGAAPTGPAPAPSLDSARLTALEQAVDGHHARLQELTQGLRETAQTAATAGQAAHAAGQAAQAAGAGQAAQPQPQTQAGGPWTGADAWGGFNGTAGGAGLDGQDAQPRPPQPG